jgi:hypothetical protein
VIGLADVIALALGAAKTVNPMTKSTTDEASRRDLACSGI